MRRADGQELRALIVQPKRLALFAYLALANPPRLHRRDSLLALFWPEADDAQARLSLRQALHFLRQALGPGIIQGRGDDEIGIDFGAIWCDAREFQVALDAGREDEALGLYTGHLLEGFHVSSVAPEFGHWLDDQRSRLRAAAVSAASSLAERAEQEGNTTLAVQRLRELMRIEPSAEQSLRRLMSLLAQSQDRTGAIRAYDEFARRLAAELDAKPSAETLALAERFRAGTGSTIDPPMPAIVPNEELVTGDTATTPGPAVSRRRVPVRLLVATAALVVLGWIATPWVSLSSRPSSAAMILAVGEVEDRTAGDPGVSIRVLRDLLATDLARVQGVLVVSHTRMQELLSQISSGEETRTSLTRAARIAGAREVLEGDVYRRTPDTFRLDIRRVDAATGVIQQAYSAEGRDMFALVERMSAHFAAEVGQPSPRPNLATLTATSLVARRYYDEGIRAAYTGSATTALRLFRSALAEDSTFAMAAYFAARAAAVVEPAAAVSLAAHALRMARHTTPRERLLIAAEWAFLTNSPSLVAVAESLVMRFPLEPFAEFELGRALVWSGDYVRALPHLRSAAQRDSLSLVQSAPERCSACESTAYIIMAYAAIDSAAAAERVAREIQRKRPQSLHHWDQLAHMLELQGRSADALAAYETRQQRARELAPDDTSGYAFSRVQVYIRAGDFSAADSLLAIHAARGTDPTRREAAWWQVVSLRNQGRLEEALIAVRRLRNMSADAGLLLAEGQVHFEMGRARDATVVFGSVASAYRRPPLPRGAPDSAPGLVARPWVWHLAHVATASAASGDTVRLKRLVDSVQAFGAMSAYGRDRAMHYHLRGLLLLARGDREGAAASLRRAVFSPTIGYTRTNLELGRVLSSLGRPREAADILAPALRGDLQASNYYVTHAELHEALANALDAAGHRDSARVHFAWLANAWKSADPAFRARAARARARSR